MSGSSLVNGSAQLREASELLERTWMASESAWRDVVRQRFEEDRLEPLRKQMMQTQAAIQQLSDVLNAARRHAADADRSSD
ncbi:MAG: hypothetical protein SFV23_14705 [Planctomycetaceae bacterium]|nr:hypothetical protein [Planctomycetaceae bacterium]